MIDQQIYLRPVDDLRVDPESKEALHFHIPAYQRGYRWATLQVTQLLDDIREFTQRRNPQPDEFYCLQPLVIKIRSNGKFEVVDGQQRLTTLLLILRYCNERLVEKHRQVLFKLTYETRLILDGFLEDPNEEVANDNVDFFHLFQAIQAIEEWFGKRESEVDDIKSALLNKTKVIWFQLAESDNPVDAFTRLNVGKIPLTNDELIRALFLRRSDSDEKDATRLQLRIANEWDQIEKALQSDAFWYFLSNKPGTGQNRIGFIFGLEARSEEKTTQVTSDAYGLFYIFNERLKKTGAELEDEWLKVKKTFLMLEEWYEDRILYHMVGYLVSEDVPIDEIRSLSQGSTKSAFEQRLRSKIYELAIGKRMPDTPNKQVLREEVADRLTELSYGSNTKEIKSLLLLFNLATLLQDRRSNLRFQFDSFKSESWDIEHIRSVADDKPERHPERRSWLDNCLRYLNSQHAENELRERIEEFSSLSQAEASHEEFDLLYEELLQYFREAGEGEAEQGIANLTLLDEHTNRSYKNAVFAVKRQRILTLDQAGIFVPLCTRNVFMKCYNPQADNLLFWSAEDRDGYEEAIVSALVNFFCGKMEGIQ
jgi:hypothetical protein